MKKYLFLLAAVILFLNGSGASEVSAQSQKTLNVEVNFNFRIGEKIYPAGIYRFESASQSSDSILRLSNIGGEEQRLIITNFSYAQKNQQPKLVFRQIGDEYFLTKIFLADGNWGYSLRPSRSLKKAEKNSAVARTFELPVRN